MAKYRIPAVVVRQAQVAPGIFDLRLFAPEIAKEACPGQFVNVWVNDRAKLLPRPISLCGIDRANGVLRLVYRVTGERSGSVEYVSYDRGAEENEYRITGETTGTEELMTYGRGVRLMVLGPLGNGFPTDLEDCCVIGGGIGIPPLLETLKHLKGNTCAVLGYRNSGMFLKDEFEKAAGRVIIATEDGSFGTKGTVIDALEAEAYVPKAILSCGPKPMLRALKAWAAERDIPLWVSMEERMACGVGACLGCVTDSTEADGHSKVKNKRVCKDGPVFRAEEVVL